MHVNPHPQSKNSHTQNSLNYWTWLVFLVCYPLEVTVSEGETKSWKKDLQGYLGIWFQSEGVDYVPVDIVQDEEEVGDCYWVLEVEEKVASP